MASRIVTFIWKIDKPTDDVLATRLKLLALKTAKITNQDAQVILIGSHVHETTETSKSAGFQKDAPHITISTKNRMQIRNMTHEISRGYPESRFSSVIKEAKASGVVNPDNTPDNSSQGVAWPSDLQEEEEEFSDVE